MRYSYEQFLKELGAKLRQMRVDRGWTLRQMIVAHGFHLAQWQGFEKGKGISVPMLLRLCETFNLTLEELIGDLGRCPEERSAPRSALIAETKQTPAKTATNDRPRRQPAKSQSKSRKQ